MNRSLNCDVIRAATCFPSHGESDHAGTIQKVVVDGTEMLMLKRIFFASLIATAAVGAGFASEPNTKTIVIGKEPASNGRQMYMSYCASCHGADGRGRGAVATSLTIPPADLTKLRKNNKGKYPTPYVISVLQSGTSTPGHGTAAMPVWGSIFAQMDGGQRSLTKALRISNLNQYLESIQAD